MRAVILRSLLVVGAGGIVLAGMLYVASTVDAQPPEVVSIAVTQPVGGDERTALITTSVEVVFSEPIDPGDAETAVRIEPEVTGTASWSGSTLIFTPLDPLELATAYTVRVTDGIRDAAGNEIDAIPAPFTFETAGRPTLVSTEPSDGEDEVAVDAAIRITFSTLMDTASVERELRVRPTFAHELRWSGEVLEIVPTDPMRPGTQYEVAIGGDATDAAGVRIGDVVSFWYRTAAHGLRVETLVPADGIDGIAPSSAVAVIFDAPIDPDTVRADMLALTPAVAGTLEVVALPGEEDPDEEVGRILRFTPSGALPPNTTFEVQLTAGMAAVDGGGLAESLAWTFTTGAPASTLSNQITFVSDRAGVANVWAMNADGTGQHQVSAELVPVVDYAVAPDGSSLVVADGRRLVYLRPDGSDRRVLTGDQYVDLDPAYGPEGRRLAFARTDAATGAGLGLWEWAVGGGDPAPLELPADEDDATPSPRSTASTGPILRAPRYAPDGDAVVFVDAGGGAVGILDLEEDRLVLVEFAATAPPAWLPDGRTVLLHGSRDGDEAVPLEAPVLPLTPSAGEGRVYRVARGGGEVSETALPGGARVLAVAPDGRIAYADERGSLVVTDSVGDPGSPVVADAVVLGAAFPPAGQAMVVALAPDASSEPGVELVDVETGDRTRLVPEGSLPRWLP